MGRLDRGRVLQNPRLSQDEKIKIETALTPLSERMGLPEHYYWVSTSGSTQAAGTSKWVALSQDAILTSAQAVNDHLKATERDVWVHALPEFHVGGIGILARAHLSHSPVFDGLLPSENPRWNPLSFERLCIEISATLSALVPTQIHDLVQAGLRSPPLLRAVVVGGGALSAELYRRARRLGWNLLPSYGLSECASQVATAPLESLQGSLKDSDESQIPDPVLLPHVMAQIGVDERIALKSAALFSGYGWIEAGKAKWSDPKKEGWFLTEDRARLRVSCDSRETSLQILGRTADFIKVGGESVDLAELERTLSSISEELPSLQADAALLPLPDERLGHTLHLAIYLKRLESGADEAPGAASEKQGGSLAASQIFERYNQRVMPFERARGFILLSEPLPRSPLGKLMRPALFEQVANRNRK